MTIITLIAKLIGLTCTIYVGWLIFGTKKKIQEKEDPKPKYRIKQSVIKGSIWYCIEKYNPRLDMWLFEDVVDSQQAAQRRLELYKNHDDKVL